VNHAPYEKISSALDRFQEAHFWIHMMEKYYHNADPFRWHLNVFLKALKEVPDLLLMAMQNEAGFPAWFREQRNQLGADPLIAALSKRRDLVVHRNMLVPQSRGTIGITEGRGFKAGLTAPIDPLEDSDKALLRYTVHFKDFDFLGLVTPDEDSLPCVEREWRLPEFDEELVDLCARAWLRVGESIAAVLCWQGAEPPPLSLNCRHDSRNVRIKVFDRDALIEQVAAVPLTDHRSRS
jgi:hypothetical protein